MNDLPSRSIRIRTIRVLVLSLSALACLAGGRAQAQNSSALSATYGRGVHAYFANQTDLAEQLFSQVIEAGSTDPRVFYFRAMTRMSCGRQQEAEEDMRNGAAFEARDPGNRHAIGKALERVQGPHRRLLEEFRQQARMDRLQQRQLQTRQRYEQLERREPEVLRRELPVPLEDLVEPSLSVPGSTAEKPAPATPAPAQAPAGANSDPAPAKPIPPAEPADEDPFGAEASGEDDIFAEPQPPAGKSEAPEEPPESTEPEDNPFGEPQPAEEPKQPEDNAEEDDPFATAPSDKNESTPADLVEETTSAGDAKLAESDRIESGQLLGVLGRVASSVIPWRGIELPSFDPPEGAGDFLSEAEPADVELGPVVEDPATIPASAEEPIESESESADLFGESTGGAVDSPASDSEPTAAPEADETEKPAGEEAEATSDDPFGEF